MVILGDELELMYGEEVEPKGVLEKVKFGVVEGKSFGEKVKSGFIEKSEGFTPIIKCGDDEIEYFNKQKKESLKAHKKYKKRNLVMAQKSLVKKVVKNLENKKKHHKIAVQKYFKNTFGDLLNDAMYELTRKQEKFPDNDEFFTVEGSCSFVGEFLLEHLPEHEVENLKEAKDSKTDKNETEV